MTAIIGIMSRKADVIKTFIDQYNNSPYTRLRLRKPQNSTEWVRWFNIWDKTISKINPLFRIRVEPAYWIVMEISLLRIIEKRPIDVKTMFGVDTYKMLNNGFVGNGEHTLYQAMLEMCLFDLVTYELGISK
ncbi:TPA: hypothetical protein N4790_004377 [Shigella sonnei]|nr:hypothetical protein [Shigella sonnei]